MSLGLSLTSIQLASFSFSISKRVVFTLAIKQANGLISTPIPFLFNKFASIKLVPEPQKGSKIVSFSFVYFLL